MFAGLSKSFRLNSRQNWATAWRDEVWAQKEYNDLGDKEHPYWNTQTLKKCWGEPGRGSFFDDIARELGLTEQESKRVYRDNLRVISIFVFAKLKISKKDFRTAFLQPGTKRTDKYLPFNDEELGDIIRDSEREEAFKNTQNKFVPPLHIGDENQDDPDLKEWRRLPFIGNGISDVLGSGQETTVMRKTLAKESVSFEKPDSEFCKYDLVGNRIVAVKVFPPCRYNAWAQEIGNLRRLRQAADTHRNIQFYLGGLRVASRGYIFFEAADCNLEQMFRGAVDEFNMVSNLFTPRNLLSEATKLAEGLLWLHDRITTKDGGKMQGNIHEDLKPKNILVFWRREKDTIFGWRWKITDFGESSIGYHERTRRADDEHLTMLTEVKVASGAYQPPEKSTAQKVGRHVDIWSFGCIFFDLLVFGCGGPKEVVAFQKLRDSKAGSAFYEVVKTTSEQTRFVLRKDLLDFQEDQERLSHPAERFLKIWPVMWRELVIKTLNPSWIDRPKAHKVVDDLHHLDTDLESMGKECSYRGKAINEAPWWVKTPNAESQRIGVDVDNGARAQPTNEAPSQHNYQLFPHADRLHVEGSEGLRPDSFLLPIGKRIVQFSGSRTGGNDSLFSDRSGKEDLKVFALDHPGSVISSSVGPGFAAILLDDSQSMNRQIRVYGASSLRGEYEHGDNPVGVCCSLSGSFAVLFPDRRVILHPSTSDQTQRALVRSKGEELISAVFSCEGQHIYVWSYSTQEPRTAYWEMFEVSNFSAQSTSYRICSATFTPGQHTSPYPKDLMIAVPNMRTTWGGLPLAVSIDRHGNSWLILQRGDQDSANISVVRLPTLKNVIAACITPDGSSVFLFQMAKRLKKLLYFDIGAAIADEQNTQVCEIILPFFAKTFEHKNAGFILRHEGECVYAYFGVFNPHSAQFEIRRVWIKVT